MVRVVCGGGDPGPFIVGQGTGSFATIRPVAKTGAKMIWWALLPRARTDVDEGIHQLTGSPDGQCCTGHGSGSGYTASVEEREEPRY